MHLDAFRVLETSLSNSKYALWEGYLLMLCVIVFSLSKKNNLNNWKDGKLGFKNYSLQTCISFYFALQFTVNATLSKVTGTFLKFHSLTL
jgi:hypothetical protein